MQPRGLVLLAYALPAFALAALYLPLYSHVTRFYAAERGVDIAALGLAWLLIRLSDAFSDPIMGWLSDRTPASWGRRRVWLALSVPVILVGTWQAFVPPEGVGLTHAAFWLFIVTLGWTMAQTPYTAWGAELASDYTGRTRVTAWRETFVLLGTLGASFAYVGGGGGGPGLTVIAIVVVIALPLFVLGAALSVPDEAPATAARLGFRVAVRTMAENRPFRRVLIAWFVNGLANGVPVTLFFFFTADRLGMTEENAGLMFVLYFVAAVIGMPFWTWLARRIGKHRAWCVAMVWACVIFAGVLFLDRGDAQIFAVISVLTGLAFGADLALPPSIQADVVELDTQQTGAARAGLFFAVWQVATKAALAISTALALSVLGASGFETGAENSESALWTLSLLYAGAPILCKLLAVGLMWRFTLERSS